LKNRGILSGKIVSPNYRGKPQIVEETEPDPPAGAHRQGGYESFFREESFEYSILAVARSAERDGRLRVHGAISFLLFPFPSRVIRRTRLWVRGRERGRRKSGRMEGRYFLLAMRLAFRATSSLLFRRLHRDRAETVHGPLYSKSSPAREMSRGRLRGLGVFDESIGGHFRYANSLSANATRLHTSSRGLSRRQRKSTPDRLGLAPFPLHLPPNQRS